jgi:hypothetical protein
MHIHLTIVVADNINNTMPYDRMHTVFYGYFVPIKHYTPPTRPGAAGMVTATVLRACTVPLYCTQ